MIRSTLWRTLCALPLLILPATVFGARPNFIVIMADDIGFGDVSAYGSKALRTPNIDRLAAEGVRFTSGYCSASTCTPTRYSFLTGEYAFRRNGTGIAPPNGQLVVPVGVPTIASVLKSSGYRTGVIGKWHLGLGQPPAPDWNGEIKPGPRELGFDYSFLLPTTNDRVPQVFVENGRVAGLDPKDPLWVGDKAPSPDHPTGVSHRHTLKMDWSHGHNQTIHNGISRIGFYTGGQAARFRDEDLADRWVEKTVAWLAAERDRPFFLFLASHDPHVPRAPHERFVGKSGLGPRGDAILQFDWCVGEVNAALDRLGGLVHSQRVLLALTQAGLTRDDAYRLVQRNAMKVWESDGGLSLLDLLKADADVSARLSNAELEGLFDLGYHFRHIDTIFTRVFG